ncbi:MAG: GDSL-type esterase/lipase family protein [Bacteroidia bacterium]|nr:GDSL-type esterase/lipase family protein [Bacteroidia bacterium]
MKVFKNLSRTFKLILCASVLVNILLVGVIYVGESHSHVFQQALARRGICSPLDDKYSSDYWARACWTNTIDKLHTDFDVAFFGNSITRGSDFQSYFPDIKIINLGYSGDNILGMLKRVPMIQKSNAKKVFIMAGTNDLVHISLDEYKTRYVNLITSIKDSIPDIEIFLESVLPSNHEMGNYAPNKKVREANAIVSQLAEQYECTFIDLYSLYANEDDELPKDLTRDGVHLFPQSYDRWAEKIRPYIYK